MSGSPASASPEPAIDGASFVITSIRVGGAAQRARDEAAVIALDTVGQETIGPAGFAMARPHHSGRWSTTAAWLRAWRRARG